jgi:hypothetical protein
MATLPPVDDVMKQLQKIPMSKEQFERTKANILKSRADARSNEPILKIAAMTQKCVEDIKDRVAYIRERRAQRDSEKEQKTIAFATALAERNNVKETEKTTKQGQKTHRTRIEVWRDEVKQLATVEKEPSSGMLHQQNSSRQHTAKRPLDNSETTFFNQLAGTTSTPVNKRLKTTAQNDSSSLVALPTSSKKSIPWLSTRASMEDEDIFGYQDCDFLDQGIRVTDQEIRAHEEKLQLHEEKKKNRRTVHHKDDNTNKVSKNHEHADEEVNRDEEDGDSEESYDTELTELEQLLAVEMAMVGVMAFLIARNEEEMRY